MQQFELSFTANEIDLLLFMIFSMVHDWREGRLSDADFNTSRVIEKKLVLAAGIDMPRELRNVKVS